MSTHQLNNMNRIRTRIPKSWILLIVFIISVIGAGAWVFTTPPDGKTNQTGIYFGNNSMNGNNVTADHIDVMNYLGTVVGTYLDSYTCEADYCIYSPWYDSSKYYAKNVSTGKVEIISSNPSVVGEFAVSKIVGSGKISLQGNFNFNHANPMLINTTNQYNRIDVDLTGASLYNTSDGGERNRSWTLLQVDGGNVWIHGGMVEGGVVYKADKSTIQFAGIDGTSILVDNLTGLTVYDSTYRVYESRFSPNSIRSVNFSAATTKGIDVSSSDNLYTGIVIAKHYYGINILKGGNIYNNLHVWGGRDGITLGAGAGGLDTISNSYIEDNDRWGIVSNYQRNVTITNNVFGSNGQAQYRGGSTGGDVALWGTTNNTVIANNIFAGTRTGIGYAAKSPVAISVADSAWANINNNMMQGNYTTAGVSSSSSGIVVSTQNFGAPGYYWGIKTSCTVITAFGSGDNCYNSTSKAFNVWNGATWQYYNGTYVNAY